MDRLSKALNLLQTSKKSTEWMSTSSKKSDVNEKEYGAISDVREMLIRTDIRKDPKYNDEFNRAMKIFFENMNHHDSNIRMSSEQTLDSVLKHLISEMNTSRVVVVLMSEIKRNDTSRSIVYALSRLIAVLKHVKINRTRAIGVHLISALAKILIRPEESIQIAVEKHLPQIFSILGPDFETQRSDSILKLYEIATSNLELSGVANRSASVVISQLATYVGFIRRKAFLNFLKVLSKADDDQNRNVLVGTLNSLRLLWPIYVAQNIEYDVESLQNIIRSSLRCLFSCHSEIVVASLELLDKIISSPLQNLNVETFYPQQSSDVKCDSGKHETTAPTSLPSSHAASRMSSLRASPVNFVFGHESPTAVNLHVCSTDQSFSLRSNSESSSMKPQSESVFEDDSDIIDPLRHLEFSSDLTMQFSSSEESLPRFKSSSMSIMIPEHLPTNISNESFFTYTAILLAKRFLLRGQCLRLLPDDEVRVSHKILAMSCLSKLALYLPKFADIPLQPEGGLGVQTLKDLQLYLNHDDDQLEATTITVFINAEKCRFRMLGEQYSEFECSFKPFVCDAVRLDHVHCTRSLLNNLKSADKLVYHTGIINDTAKLACDNYLGNYFLLRVAVAEYLASIEWIYGNSSFTYLPDEIFEIYLNLLADDDQRVRNAAAENLPLLVKNANYTAMTSSLTMEKTADNICSAFQIRPLTISMSSYYDLLQYPGGSGNSVIAENLSIILKKIFDALTTNADEKQQAGVANGLYHLLNCYKPKDYADAWGLTSNVYSSRSGLILAHISKCTSYCRSLQTFVQFLEIATQMTAGLYTVNLIKAISENRRTVLKLPDPSTFDELLLLQLRILNLYYSLITENRQQIAHSRTRSSPLSPVRRALPVGVSNTQSWEQRIAAASTFLGANVKMSRKTSFLQSSSLVHFANSLRGAYVNYMNSLGSDASDRFTGLLISALNCLSCTLEVMQLSQIADLIEEILLYCRNVVEIVPKESIRVSVQLFKILFGSNLANLSFDALKSYKLHYCDPSTESMDESIFKSEITFKKFIADTTEEDYGNIQIIRCTGWLRKDIIRKDSAPVSTEITTYVAMFESFVSLTIRLYQSTNSVDVQCSVLDLLCTLVRGGINYSMLDPETRLLNFVIEQVNEIGAWNRTSVDTVEKLLYSVFNYFVVLSHTECRGQMIMESARIRALADYLIKACDIRPYLISSALNCLQVLLIDCIGVRHCFDMTLLKMLQIVERLAGFCPTKVIQLWAFAVLGSRTYGDKESSTKVCLSLLESFQQLSGKNWNFSTTISAVIFMFECCKTITVPLNSLFKKMMNVLESDDMHCFLRLSIVLPYVFILLCILKENANFTKIENFGEKLGRSLMVLLGQCLMNLQRLSYLTYFDEESIENSVVWYLLTLCYAVRSGNIKCVADTFSRHFSTDISDLQSLSVFYPRIYAHLFAFLNDIGLHGHPLFYSSSSRQLNDACVMNRCRTAGPNDVDDIIRLSDSCSPENFWIFVIRGWLMDQMKHLDIAVRKTLFENISIRAKSRRSAAADLDVVELIASTEALETFTAVEFFKNKLSESALLDGLIVKLLNAYQSESMTSKTLLTHFLASGQTSTNFISKWFDCFGGTAEIPVKNCIIRIGDPESFTTDIFADMLQKIIANKNLDIQAVSICIMLCNIEEKYAETTLKKAYECKRYDVLSSFIDVLDQFKNAVKYSGDLYNEQTSLSVNKVDALSTSYISLAFDPLINSSLQLFVQSKIANRPESIVYEKASDWATESTIFDYWIQRYVSSLSTQADLDTTEIICAVTFGITRRSFFATIDQTQISKKVVEQQLSLAVTVDRLLQRIFQQGNALFCHESQKSSDRCWKINIINRTGRRDFDTEFFSDAIQTAFDVTQRIQRVFRRKRLKTFWYFHLEKLAKAVIRLPFFNDISCIPRSALMFGWKPEPEIHHTAISIPTVNIHFLGNIEILQEFVWRILWAGWNRRSNFDIFSMSLFGVISSTPSGSELANTNMNITERIMASTVAVEGLTNLLLETLLYPERGNPVMGRFIAKPRDASAEFLLTSYGQRLCMLQVKLLGNAAIDTIFRKNLENLNIQEKKYRPGQFSVLTSWNMAGVLDRERNLCKDIMQNDGQSKERLPSSDSSYLLDSGHDTTYESCLRMLFDTYSHWFRAGVENVPLPLLSATVKSMSLLSDLFVELDQYRFVFGHMKTLFTVRSYLDNVDVGNIIYSLLKCVSILGIEDLSISKAEAQKAALTWVETGLTSEFTEIRVRTLQGCLFLLQSISYEDLKPVYTLLETFLLDRSQLNNTGLYEYETMLWTVRFFLFDNPSYSADNSRQTFIRIICENFNAFTTPDWLMNIITAGTEKLIVGARIYVLTFSRMTVQALENYFKVPQKFIYALRIFIACLYRGLEEGRVQHLGIQTYDPRIHLMEQHSMIFKILSEGTEEDALQLMKVLPYLLIDSLNQSELINSILQELIHRYTDRPHPRSAAIFTIIHHWFAVLHSRETESVVLEWTLNGLESFKYVTDPTLFRFYVNAFLCSSSPNPNIANLFHVVIGRTSPSAWIDDCLFAFSVRSLLLRMDEKSRNNLKVSMENFVRDGKTCQDSRRIAFFPPL